MYRQFGTHDFTWYKSHVIPILLTILPRSINFSITSSKNLLQVFTSLCLRFFCRSPRLSISLSLLNHPPHHPTAASLLSSFCHFGQVGDGQKLHVSPSTKVAPCGVSALLPSMPSMCQFLLPKFMGPLQCPYKLGKRKQINFEDMHIIGYTVDNIYYIIYLLC